MRINLEHYRDSAECERAWNLLKLAATSSSSASVSARIFKEGFFFQTQILEVPEHVAPATKASELTNKNTIRKAQGIFLRKNPKFAKTLSPEMRALAVEENYYVPLPLKSPPAWESIAQSLRERPENITIHSMDDQKISVPFAMLPEYFQAMARVGHRNEIQTDFDSQTISDYLDYHLGVLTGISDRSLSSLIRLHQFAHFVHDQELLVVLTYKLLRIAGGSQEVLDIVIPNLLTAILRSPLGEEALFRRAFIDTVRFAKQSIQKSCLERLESVDKKAYPIALLFLMEFALIGIGMKVDVQRAQSLQNDLRQMKPPIEITIQNGSISQVVFVKPSLPAPTQLDLSDAPLDHLFQTLLSRGSLSEEEYTAVREAFYQKISQEKIDVKQRYLEILEGIAAGDDLGKKPVAEYHLSRFYEEGIGCLKNEANALDLLKRAAAHRYFLAEEKLEALESAAVFKITRKKKQFLEVYKAPDDVAVFTAGDGAEFKIHQALLPKKFERRVDCREFDKVTLGLFADFQYGLGIPVSTPFKDLLKLYELANRLGLVDLLKATTDLILKTVQKKNKDELLPQLFDAFLLPQEPMLCHMGIFVHIAKLMKDAGEKAQKALVDKITPLADNAHPTAQYLLGLCYDGGIGVKQDDAQAFEWCQKAADQGFAPAQNNLGFMYENGRGVEQLGQKAAEWYKKAADQGLAPAQNNLGFMYYMGKGVEQSDQKATEWYKKAADQGFAGAQFNLGCMYQEGKGVEQSNQKAVECYQKAADQEFAQAQNNLGYMYQEGKGVEQSNQKAIECYQKAANQGLAQAQCNLGWMYEKGRGVEQSNQKAAEWYRKAADQGNAEARRNLERLNGN